MGQIISVTGLPQRTTSADSQPLYSAVDVGMFDELSLMTNLVGLEGAGSVAIDVITGMQLDTDDGWVTLFSNSSSSVGVLSVDVMLKGTFLRYIRWRVSSLSGSTSATFAITGVGRSYCTYQ